MSTSTATSRRPRSETSPEGGRYDQFIEERLDKTRFQVKLVDLASSMMVLVAAVLSILLVLAVIDHWIVSLGAWGRWSALLGLLAGVAWYVARVVAPLLFGRISSVYAARTIERSVPSLKNSLINFLMFRSDRAGLRASIYQAIRHQAAADLSHVQVETAVDRSGLIKIGYVLAGVLALCAAYTILSPKSTFQSAGRIIAPWADTAPPTRVRIENVRPGNKELYHGEPVTVSASCYDARTGEPVTLFYSTLDGRLSGESVAMQSTEAGLIYRCLLSPDGEGIQQDLVYWIEAGDARSPSYRLTVLPAPTILVERVEYDYPAYTGQPRRVVERQGDVKGLEGTRVTVHASANVPIRSAEIEFDPHDATSGDTAQASDSATVDSSSSDPARLELAFDGRQAWGTFVLELDGTRTRPKRSFYRVRFSTEDGLRGRHPVLHRIEVTRDLSPEIEILAPTRDRIEVPEDGRQKIELRGIDPDYGLSRITLRAVAGGHDVTTATLLDDPAGQTGQVVVGHDFKPSDHGLRAGDAVAYWAVAEDNRTSPLTGDPAPNDAKTRTYHMLIVPSEKQTGPENATPDPEEPVPDPSSSPSHPDEPAPPDTETSEDGSTESAEGDGQKSDQTGGQGGGEGNQATSDSSGSESGDTQQDGTGGEGSGTGSKDQATSGAGANDGGQRTGESGRAGDSSSDGSTGEGGEGSAGESTDGAESGQSGGSGSSRGGPGGDSEGGQQTTPSESGTEPTGEGAYRQEPLHDGEAFERALEYLQQQQGGHPSDANDSGQASGDPKSGNASAGSQSPEGQDGGAGQERPHEADANGSAGGRGQEQIGSPKPQSGQESGSSGGAKQQQDGAGAPKDGQQQQAGNQDAGQRKEGSSGNGGKPKGGAKKDQQAKQPKGGSGKPKGSGQGDDGKSGAGQKSQDKSGSAGSQQENRDQQKKQGSQSGKPKPGSGSQSPSHSKRQSDSSGSQGGDRSGGGKEGGGQGVKQQGNDSSGSSSPGDEGKGASSESGAGDEANRPGDRTPSGGETGTPGAQQGHGSATDPSPGGKGEGGRADGPDPEESTETASGSPATGAADKRGERIPLGGGQPSDAELRGFDLTGKVPPGEKPNLEYTRKAANLVLEYLKDQEASPDQELLDKLGWTDEQMREFIARWESMKRTAAENEGGKRELDEALRSLGLRPRHGTTRSVESIDDRSRGLRDSGGQSAPPPSIREQFNAYKKGTARIGGN